MPKASDTPGMKPKRTNPNADPFVRDFCLDRDEELARWTKYALLQAASVLPTIHYLIIKEVFLTQCVAVNFCHRVTIEELRRTIFFNNYLLLLSKYELKKHLLELETDNWLKLHRTSGTIIRVSVHRDVLAAAIMVATDDNRRSPGSH